MRINSARVVIITSVLFLGWSGSTATAAIVVGFGSDADTDGSWATVASIEGVADAASGALVSVAGRSAFSGAFASSKWIQLDRVRFAFRTNGVDGRSAYRLHLNPGGHDPLSLSGMVRTNQPQTLAFSLDLSHLQPIRSASLSLHVKNAQFANVIQIDAPSGFAALEGREVTAVPEPSSVWSPLLLTWLVFRQRRRKS